MIKKLSNYLLLTITLIGFLALSQNAEAQRTSGDFGIGIIIGEPTGISPKLWTGSNTALAAAASWSFSRNATIHLHLDYQIHNFSLINVDRGSMSFYYGIGGRLLARENRDSKLGVRLPLGLNYLFPNDPLEIFMEIVPILDLAPDTDFSGNGGLGIRYYF